MKDKTNIRQLYMENRLMLPRQEVEAKSKAIIQNVIKTPEYIEAKHILLYADCNHEVETRELFEYAILHKKKVYFPKCAITGNDMEFYQVVSIKQLEGGRFGIQEPVVGDEYRFIPDKAEDTLVILPGVAFDTRGYRIGYGKGYYDKYFSKKRAFTLMALAYSNQIIDELPNDPHDIRMDKIVTEEIIYSFPRL